jgi:hypothetical protein
MKIKDYYNIDYAKFLSQKIKPVYQNFHDRAFIKYIGQNALEKEFLDRMNVFVDAFELYLSGDYEQTIGIFESILGPELEQETGMFSEGWWLWPVGKYVERHGIILPFLIAIGVNSPPFRA